MTDAHAHFAEEGYLFPEEWERISAAGVDRVVLASDTLAHSEAHRDFSRRFAGAYFCAGVHPTESAEYSAACEEKLRALIGDEKCVAVGEIGLDYHYPDTEKRAQREAFAAQLLLAAEAGLPVQIHSRDACADTLAVLKEYRAALTCGFLMHCYSYGAENLAAFLELGAYFSFGGVICFRNARRAVESVAACPTDRILSETDSPYLSPFRGQKNSPANIPLIVEKIAKIKGCGFCDAAAATDENAARLFSKLR